MTIEMVGYMQTYKESESHTGLIFCEAYRYLYAANTFKIPFIKQLYKLPTHYHSTQSMSSYRYTRRPKCVVSRTYQYKLRIIRATDEGYIEESIVLSTESWIPGPAQRAPFALHPL